MIIPAEGGFPEPAFPGEFEGHAVHCVDYDLEKNVVYLWTESQTEARNISAAE